jgi:hypothetical protein
MAVSNLHTLDSDILYSILTLCPNLTTLYSLITTHPAIYNAFSARRRLILRLVFRRYGNITAAEAFITRIQCANLIDYVAFREAWRPNSLPLRSNKRVVTWATALLAAYHKAGLQDERLAFAKQIAKMIIESKRDCTSEEMRTLVKAVVRTYMTAKLSNEAVTLQERVRIGLNPRKGEHSAWCKEIVATHKKAGNADRALQMQIECWEQYKTVVGPGSDVALDWARTIVMEYKLDGKEEEALQFHKRVRSGLDPTTAPYVAWSRQLIHMLQREKKAAEALTVTEEVWRHLNINVTGYRAWAYQLSEMYEAMERPEDAIAVCKACWTVMIERLEQAHSRDSMRYQARGAGLVLAKVLKKYGRLGEARGVEDRCKDFVD